MCTTEISRRYIFTQMNSWKHGDPKLLPTLPTSNAVFSGNKHSTCTNLVSKNHKCSPIELSLAPMLSVFTAFDRNLNLINPSSENFPCGFWFPRRHVPSLFSSLIHVQIDRFLCQILRYVSLFKSGKYQGWNRPRCQTTVKIVDARLAFPVGNHVSCSVAQSSGSWYDVISYGKCLTSFLSEASQAAFLSGRFDLPEPAIG